MTTLPPKIRDDEVRRRTRQVLELDGNLAYLGDGNTPSNLFDPDIPGNVWVQQQTSNGRGTKISFRGPSDSTIPLTSGTPVFLFEDDEGQLYVARQSKSAQRAAGINTMSAREKTSSEFVSQQSLITLLPVPTQPTASLTLNFKAWSPNVNYTYNEASDLSADFTGSIPAAGNQAWVTAVYNSDGTAVVYKSTEVGVLQLLDRVSSIQENYTAAQLADPFSMPIWSFLLSDDPSAITQDDINNGIDHRPVINPPLNSSGPGSGTVTSVSVATANGFSGTVANPTTTPAITIIAGAITPTSVAASGTVTGSNLSGTNTGDQTITLTGAVTGSGTGSFATTYAGVLPLAKLADGATAGVPLVAGGAGDPNYAALNLAQATAITGILPVGNGGTGAATRIYPLLAPAASSDNVIAAATATIDALTIQTSDNNTTKRALKIVSSANAELAYIGPTGALGGANLTITSGGFIAPSADGASALIITKANGTTQVVRVDTTNSRVTVFSQLGVGAAVSGTEIAVFQASNGGGQVNIRVNNNSGNNNSAAGISSELAGVQYGVYVITRTDAASGTWTLQTRIGSALGARVFVDNTGQAGINKSSSLTGTLHVQGIASGVTAVFQNSASTPGNLSEWQDSGAVILSKVNSAGNVGVRMGSTALTAYLHLAAGTTAASTSPLKFTSGPLNTTAEVGANEFLTDKAYLTITTGAARKEYTLNDAALTSGVQPVATTNGRLTNLVAGTSSTNPKPIGVIAPDHYADVSVGGAEATIFSNTLAANVFAANGDKVVAFWSGIFSVLGTETVQLKAYFDATGSTVVWDSTGVVPALGTASFDVTVKLIRVSSTVVRCTVTLATSGASGFNYCTTSEVTGLTLTATNVLKLTGQSSGVGSGTGDIVGKAGFYEWLAAA